MRDGNCRNGRTDDSRAIWPTARSWLSRGVGPGAGRRTVGARSKARLCLWRAVRIFGNFVDGRDIGRVMFNSGVITERAPDTVRGADVAYYSYARLPKGKLPAGYRPEVPEVVIEVRSANDRWPEILEKVSEYLNVGALFVVVLDPETQIALVFGADDAPKALIAEDELVLPGVFDDFRVRVRRFFESGRSRLSPPRGAWSQRSGQIGNVSRLPGDRCPPCVRSPNVLE
jgi:Uma2 family endonuclease